jgi:hypothetical protein
MMTTHYDGHHTMMMMIDNDDYYDRDDGDVNIMMLFDYMSNCDLQEP